jgi:hypothetical protein
MGNGSPYRAYSGRKKGVLMGNDARKLFYGASRDRPYPEKARTIQGRISRAFFSKERREK